MDFSILSFSVAVFFAVSSTQFGLCWSSGNSSNNFITWEDLSVDNYLGKLDLDNKVRVRVIVVAKDGSGDSRTVQGAVDLVPDGNEQRVKIIIRLGIYREKVVVPVTKPYISFIGNQSSETVISWNCRASDKGADGRIVGTFASASVAIESDYFCARGITFELKTNGAAEYSSERIPGAQGMQAVALRVSGDKAMFYKCRILGSQDTLFDHNGRHYFFRSYIQGSIDFIFGNGRSLYQGCVLHAVSASYGAIAASQRNSTSVDSGFSFLNCKLNGSGIIYLGRAWGRYARVVYSFCHLDGIVIPQGWNDWGDPSRRGTVLFGEFKCKGSGADPTRRVPWAKSLDYEEAKPFLDRNFIDGDQWLKL